MPRYGTTLPRSLDSLSRPELAARLETLRAATDALFALSELQGAMPFECIGKMKVEEMDLGHRLGVYGAHSVTPPSVDAEQIAEVVVQGLHRVAERVSA